MPSGQTIVFILCKMQRMLVKDGASGPGNAGASLAMAGERWVSCRSKRIDAARFLVWQFEGSQKNDGVQSCFAIVRQRAQIMID